MVLENQDTGVLTFNPLSCWLKTNREKDVCCRRGWPISVSTTVLAGREFPTAYENIQAAVLERGGFRGSGYGTASGSAGLSTGSSNKTKRWNLGLRLTLPDGESRHIQCALPTHRSRETEGDPADEQLLR